jgi:uncharacterized protein (DUF433 family)
MSDSTPKRQVAFRIRPRTLEHLKRRVRETGLSQTDLTERYLEEGLRMDEHPLIVFRDGPMGRRPGLAGSRLDVWQVVNMVRANGSAQEAAAYLEIPIERVLAGMRYYADYSDEIEDWIDRQETVARREQATWRHQASLAG